MRLQAEGAYRPYIVFRLKIGPGAVIYLTIENIGKTAALDIELTTTYTVPAFLKDSTEEASRRDIRNSSIFMNGLDTLAPNQRITFFLTSGQEIRNHDPHYVEFAAPFNIMSKYRWMGSEHSVCETSVIDLRIFHDSWIDASLDEHRKEMQAQLQEKIRSSIR